MNLLPKYATGSDVRNLLNGIADSIEKQYKKDSDDVKRATKNIAEALRSTARTI